MGDAYKATKNFRNCKGVQNTFSRMFTTGENFPEWHMGQEDMRTEHAKEGSHTRDRASDWWVLSNISMVGKEMGEIGLWWS